MLKDRLVALFKEYDPEIQMVIARVLTIEQEHISMEKPRIKEDIDAIVEQVANDQLRRAAR
jgi:hypothetical protein